MLGDIKDALRQLRKSFGFTATAVSTLALGIGATTAIFTLVHQVMLKSLPVAKPQELWRVGDKIRCCNWGGYTQGDDGNFSLFSWDAYRYFREHTPEFADVTALQAGSLGLGVRKEGSQAPLDTRTGQYVSGNFFRTFGVGPWRGRLMTDSDDTEGAPPVAVMSYHTWEEKYASDPGVVGATYQINGHPFTVIGVSAPGFFGAKMAGWGMPDFWLPVTKESLIDHETPRIKRASSNFLDIIGRVRPGVHPRTLEAKLKVELHDWLASHVPDMEPNERQLWQQQTLHLIPGGAGVEVMRDEYEHGLKLLLAAAGCVLLVACANLANLMLARGLKDRTQTSVRVALGASRSRLIRKALVESVTLAAIGGMLGIAVAYAGTKLIVYLAFNTSGPAHYVPIDSSPSVEVLLFTFALSVLTGVAFGMAPAWMTSQADPVEALRGANRSVGGGRSFAQKGLVVAQAAMSLVLLTAAALLGKSLRNLEHQNFGFETNDRYIASINPTLGNYTAEQMAPMFRRIDERLMQIPGVRSVAPVLYGPMTGDSWNEGIRVLGQPEPDAKADVGAGWARVMPGFFETIGARLLQGRTFSDQDTLTTRNVAVVNEAFVRRFLKGQNPIGLHFGTNKLQHAGVYEIIGVVKDIRYMTWGYRKPIGPMFWASETQMVNYDSDPPMKGFESSSHFLYQIAIWAPGHRGDIEALVRKAIASVESELVVYQVDSYSAIVSNDFQQQNMIATLVLLFGALGLVLAAVGLYGVMAYTVEQRTSEIGLRMALGAGRSGVVRMVLTSAFAQIGFGLLLGIPAAIAAGRLMHEQLFQVDPWDPAVLTTVALVLAAAALFAAVVPASRAASVEPLVALRNE